MQKQLALGLTASEAGAMRRNFLGNEALLRSFEVQSVKTRTATSLFTEQLVKQDVTLRHAAKNRKVFNETLKEQLMLQKMLAVQWSRSAVTGKVSADAIVPRGSTESVDKLTRSFGSNLKALRAAKKGTEEYAMASEVMRMRLGMANQVLASGAQNMIKWGKNTQWAGRQLMVGFTMPLAVFAAVAGKAFYELDKSITSITKVYDTYATDAIGRERELAEVRKTSIQVARDSAKRYGAAMQETLDVEQQLAATGMRGQELYKNTAQIQAAATVGQMDHNKATEAAITLNTVFGMTSEEVGDSFAYMSAVANATSLTMEDFSAALPRVGGTVKALGGNLQDVGLLLTAMKAQGISAEQGANAIKSAAASMIKPTKAAKEILGQYGINIDAISKKNAGNVVKNFIDLSAAMGAANMSADDTQKALVALFGKYQLTRVNAMVTGLRDVNKEGSQMKRAFGLAADGAEEWQRVFSGALDQSLNSASGKFKRAVESFKAEFATVGESVMPAATMLVKFASAVAKAFNALPSVFKQGAFLVAALLAIVGPIIMLTGLFGNMIGQIFKVSASIVGLKYKFKAMTPEQRIQQMLANQSSMSWHNQADAARALSTQLSTLTAQLTRVAMAQNLMSGAATSWRNTPLPLTGFQNANPNAKTNLGGIGPALPSLKENKSGRMYDASTGRYASQAQMAAMAAAANHSQAIAQNSARAARDWNAIGNKAMMLGMGAGFMTQMVAGGNVLLSKLANALILAGLIGPTIVKGIAKSKVGAYVSGAIASGATGGKVKQAVGKLGGMIAGLGSKAGPIGMGIAAAALAGLFVWKKITGELSRAREEQKKIANSANDWAEILGFVAIKAGQVKTATGEVKDSADGVAKKFAEANKPLAEMVRNLKAAGKEQEVVDAAIAEGIKVRRAGGNQSQAAAAAAATLKVAGYKTDEVKDLMFRVKGQVDFGDTRSMIENQLAQFENDFNRIAQNHFKQGKWEGFSRVWSGRSDLNAGATEAAKQMGKAFWDGFIVEDQAGRKRYFDSFEKRIANEQETLFDSLGDKAKKQLSDMGLKNVQDIARWAFANGGAESVDNIVRDDDQARAIIKQIKAEEELARAIAKENGLTDEQIKNIHTLADLRPQLDMATMTATQAEAAYTDAVFENQRLLKGPLSEAQKLAILNTYRHAMGLGDATNSAQGFDEVIDGVNTTLGANGQMLNETALTLDDWTGAMKNAMSGAQNFAIEVANSFKSIYDSASADAIQKRGEAAQEALEERAEKMDKKFDKRKEALEAKWDRIMSNRTRGIKRQIDLEKSAEEQRKRNFEAERQRLERMANLANLNNDFNLELQQGNFDEAAKIGNDIAATQADYDLQDANQSAELAFEKRQKILEGLEEKENEALEKKKKREMDALEAERERYRKSVEAQRKAIQQKTQDDVEANRRYLERKSRTLELELSIIRATIPRNKEEYDKQITQIEAAYKRYGVDLKAQGAEWSGVIGKGLQSNIAAAAAGLANDINWKAIGSHIVGELTGFTPEAFRSWIMTGEMPTGDNNIYKPTAGLSARDITRHTGGVIDDSSGSRAGYSASSSQNPGEKTVLAKKGEFMVQKSAVDKFGVGFLDMINKGQMPGGFMAPVAMSAGALLTSMFTSALRGGPGATSATPGNYGDVKLTKEQLSNASRIMRVGRTMGATNRDLQIALMTAMQESRLRNIDYGDRDSLGLFQQRPSQGWGTKAQVMNPEYAAGKFFASLLGIKTRNKMSLTQAAQAVQRSAFPDAYAKWAPMAASVLKIPGLSTGADIRWDNTIANLHKGEKVLTAPLSAKLERGIDKIDRGSANEYNVTVDLRGAFIRDDVDIEKAIDKALEKRESKFGRSRKIV